MTRAQILEVLRGLGSARPVLLGAVLFLSFRQEVAWWWTPVQAFSDVFFAWLLFSSAREVREAALTALWGPPRTVISSHGGELE
jgi:hypothetical protein